MDLPPVGYSTAGWLDFGTALATVAGALTGLLFGVFLAGCTG
jgi:hypothetical protein